MDILIPAWIIMAIVAWFIARDSMPKNTGCFMALLIGPFYLINHLLSSKENRKVITYNDDPDSDKPTRKQLLYAQDLGIDPPTDIKRWQLSRMIDEAIEKQNPVTARHRAFADLYAVRHDLKISKRHLFRNIYNELKAPGREPEMAEWFTFRVFRTLAGGEVDPSKDNPRDPFFGEIASQIVAFPGAVRSMRNYEGDDLIWFGTYTDPNGHTHEGGSTRTTAYKQAAILLNEKLAKALGGK